jgi:hypothetical protein
LSPSKFDTSPAELSQLKMSGVADGVILAMVLAPTGLSEPPVVQAAASISTASPSSPVPTIAAPVTSNLSYDGGPLGKVKAPQNVKLSGGQTFDVKVIGREFHQTGYSAVIPGYAHTNVNCGESNCSASTNVMPPRNVAYQVSGATLTLQLPDGRMALVNCNSKYAFKLDYINQRSCRMPVVDDIQAEFKGNTAKLRWVVSLDGRKTDSETYRIIAVQ